MAGVDPHPPRPPQEDVENLHQPFTFPDNNILSPNETQSIPQTNNSNLQTNPSYINPKQSTAKLSFSDILKGGNHQSLAASSKSTGLNIYQAMDSESVVLKPKTWYQGKPAVTFSVSEKKSLVEKLEFVLIGKFSHGRPTMLKIKELFSALNLHRPCNISAFDKKHIFIECACKIDYYRIWLKLNWLIDGFVMRIIKWTSEFNPIKESPIVPVWIRIEGLPLYLFDEVSLLSIANPIGKPIKVDPRNVSHTLVNCARICVELDVSQPLLNDLWVSFVDEKSKTMIEGFTVKVFYDVLPSFCLFCSHIGHDVNSCKRRVEESFSQKSVVVLHTSAVEVDVSVPGSGSASQEYAVRVPRTAAGASSAIKLPSPSLPTHTARTGGPGGCVLAARDAFDAAAVREHAKTGAEFHRLTESVLVEEESATAAGNEVGLVLNDGSASGSRLYAGAVYAMGTAADAGVESVLEAGAEPVTRAVTTTDEGVVTAAGYAGAELSTTKNSFAVLDEEVPIDTMEEGEIVQEHVGDEPVQDQLQLGVIEEGKMLEVTHPITELAAGEQEFVSAAGVYAAGKLSTVGQLAAGGSALELLSEDEAETAAGAGMKPAVEASAAVFVGTDQSVGLLSGMTVKGIKQLNSMLAKPFVLADFPAPASHASSTKTVGGETEHVAESGSQPILESAAGTVLDHAVQVGTAVAVASVAGEQTVLDCDVSSAAGQIVERMQSRAPAFVGADSWAAFVDRMSRLRGKGPGKNDVRIYGVDTIAKKEMESPKAVVKIFDTSLPIDYKDVSKVSWSKLMSRSMKVLTSRSLSPPSRSSKKLSKLRKRVEFIKYDEGTAIVLEKEKYDEMDEILIKDLCQQVSAFKGQRKTSSTEGSTKIVTQKMTTNASQPDEQEWSTVQRKGRRGRNSNKKSSFKD